MKKTYVVFGAGGSIGKAVTYRLFAEGHRVIALVREHHQQIKSEMLARGIEADTLEDVSNRGTLEEYSSYLSGKIDGIIYAVGHCPPNGFPDAICPLSQLPLEKYQCEINMHQIGVLNVFQCMTKNLNEGGCFVFVSSAITRLKGQFPPFLQVHYHASVIGAEDWLIEGMRHDPEIAARGIRIHRIAPAAVDTPFHQGGPKPPKLIPVDTVVQEIVLATESREVVDKQIV